MKSKLIGAMVLLGAFLGLACPEPPVDLWSLVQAQYQNLRAFSAEIFNITEIRGPAVPFPQTSFVSETIVFCFPFVWWSLDEPEHKGLVINPRKILRIENIQTGQAWVLYNHGAWEEIIDQSRAGRHQVWLEHLGVKELVVEEINVAELEGKQFWHIKGRVEQGTISMEAHVWVDCQSLFITRVVLKSDSFQFTKIITNFDPNVEVDPKLFAPPPAELIAQKTVIVPEGRTILARVWDKLKTLNSFMVRKRIKDELDPLRLGTHEYEQVVVYQPPYLRQELRRPKSPGVPDEVFVVTIADLSMGIIYEYDPKKERWTKDNLWFYFPELAFYMIVSTLFSLPLAEEAMPVVVEEETWHGRKVWRIAHRSIPPQVPPLEWWVDQETLVVLRYIAFSFSIAFGEYRWGKREVVVISFEANPEIPAELFAVPAQAKERRVLELPDQEEARDLAPPLVWKPFSFAKLEEAKAQGKGIVLFFTADWCEPSHRLESGPLRNPMLQEFLVPLILLKVDLTEYVGEVRKAANTFRVRILPTLLFLNPEGKEIGRVSGYTPQFFAEIQRILKKGW